MAKFKVTTHEGYVTAYEGKYWVDEGVLSVLPDEGSGNKVLFSQAGWLMLEVNEADPPAM
jgi:hypothetical protein